LHLSGGDQQSKEKRKKEMSGIFGCLALILTHLVQTNFAKEVRTNEFSIPLIIFSIKSCDSSAHITLGQHPNIFFN